MSGANGDCPVRDTERKRFDERNKEKPRAAVGFFWSAVARERRLLAGLDHGQTRDGRNNRARENAGECERLKPVTDRRSPGGAPIVNRLKPC